MIGRGMGKKLKEELFVAFAACWWGIDGRGKSGGSGCSRGALLPWSLPMILPLCLPLPFPGPLL